jgi:sec-independent protein translocase protein TatA
VFNISPLEIMVIAVIALIVLGPARLPEVARSVGRGMREFRSALSGIGGDDEDEADDFVEDDEIVDEAPPLPKEPPGAAAEADAGSEPDEEAEPDEGYQNDAESKDSSSSSSGLV